ncbi:hypothetical protein vseg_021304 [Gypsophila vaccaria]
MGSSSRKNATATIHSRDSNCWVCCSNCSSVLTWLRRRKAENKRAASHKNAEFARFDFGTIRSATANFSVCNKLGEGGSGVVYKGTLKSGEEVAIKRLHHDIDLSAEVFMIESRVVARIQHTNLVKHLGICSEGKEKMLVYEFLPNASLACFLFDPIKRMLIKWDTWFKIILGVAKGLEYLHEGCPSMLHRGLKSSNVLLDNEMNPKIADFGLNKLFETTQQLTNTCSTVGTRSEIATFAYIAPEYCFTGWYSCKSDVYSFGVIVLETVSNLNKGNFIQSSLTDTLIHARKLWNEDRLSELIHPTLRTKCSETDVIRCIQIGVLCVQEDAEHRPTMPDVVLMLTGKLDIPLPRHL